MKSLKQLVTEIKNYSKRHGLIKKFNAADEKWRSKVAELGLKSYTDSATDLPEHKDVDKYYRLLFDDLKKELDTVQSLDEFENIKKSFIPMKHTSEKTLLFRAILITEDKFKKT